MSEATAIGMVSESLKNLLDGEMSLSTNPEVTILAPDEAGGNKHINLFLYKVQENAILKNLDWQLKSGSATQLVPPPLSVNLFYLMTAYSANDTVLGNIPAHEILGEAMRVFYENPIVPEIYLTPGLSTTREEIKIMMNTLDLEEMSKVWATFTKAYRLSLLYEVSVVQLDMLPASERAMSPRARSIGVPTVGAPYSPPVLETIDPVTGPAGTIVTVHGSNLNGWKAYAYVSGRKIADGLDVVAESFQVTLPVDLNPGFHEIRLDISHLSRQTFLFEVTP
jgi:Pvc16 N-terminal domain/IPT/TIG domain